MSNLVKFELLENESLSFKSGEDFADEPILEGVRFEKSKGSRVGQRPFSLLP